MASLTECSDADAVLSGGDASGEDDSDSDSEWPTTLGCSIHGGGVGAADAGSIGAGASGAACDLAGLVFDSDSDD